ncbi:MurR/RpiR family transcriptional regulator [Bacillus sp. CGMCC 1.16607]|uniref:MurR/RpiR family transcriptional regulator n=1 Tax=Bacillus sp. CGMCC 1.16607 TaxID=3351842 RepID=UPI00362D072E
MNSVKETIKSHYDSLTKLQKIVAKTIIEDPKVVILQTAKELGVLTGTSETTVIRFCYAIGYKGYANLQDEIQKELLVSKDMDTLSRFEKMSDSSSNFEELAYKEMNQDLKYIQKTLEEFNNQLYSDIVDAIIKAKRIVVIGFRISYAPAHWLSYTLNVVKGNTTLYRGEVDDANFILSDIDENYLVIAISFPRYAQETISFVRAAKSKGAKIFALTDDEFSPIGRYSDFLIKVTTPEPTSIKGMPTIFSILNLFVTGVMNQDKNNVQKQLSKYRESSNLFHSFVASNSSKESD